ncbi:MAG TPA: hypothetical protein VEA41_18695 [Salinarimonas sp.]|nr:hypothetical protein [Salinarimonas sp.]
MATVALATIRQRVAAAITSGASSWRESTDPWDTFGAGGGDGEGRMHLGFAVGIPADQQMGDRQRRTLGGLSETRVMVRCLYNLGALDQLTDYDAALAAEQDVRNAVSAIQRGADLHLLYVEGDRSVADGWMTSNLTFKAIHHMPLQ